MMRRNRIVTQVLMTGMALALSPSLAQAQNPFDPPTATRPQPNVMLLMDGSLTTMINGQNCRGLCHVEPGMGCGGEYDCDLYRHGETRLQLARRVLTGGWGWNTSYVSGPHGHVDGTTHAGQGPADALQSNIGVMDQYRGVRWGLMWFDGLGTRHVLDPTANNQLAQQRVIDFGINGGNEVQMNVAARPSPSLNSFAPLWRTRLTAPGGGRPFTSSGVLPWDGAANPSGCNGTGCDPGSSLNDSNARQSRALQYLHDYWHLGVSPAQWQPPASAAGLTYNGLPLFPPGAVPNDQAVLDSDPSNVLVSPGAPGCRRNISIMLLDGHGGAQRFTNNLYRHNGFTSPEAAATLARIGGAGVNNDPEKRHQVFAIRFGVGEQDAIASTNGIADRGYDGVAGGGGITAAFEAAPGGVIADLTAMYAAFAAIFSLVFDGDYNGAAPVVTLYGDRLARTQFRIQDCSGVSPTGCNIGRPGRLEWYPVNPDGSLGFALFDAGATLRSHDAAARNLFTTPSAGLGTATETNCSSAAGACASNSLSPIRISNAATGLDAQFRTSINVPNPLPPFGSVAGGSDIDFLRGVPTARFANGVMRGDTDGDNVVDNPYKLSDIANSQPVVVGAPSGIGEDIERWNAFLNAPIRRFSSMNGNGSNNQVRYRDQVIYVGGNDGFLHAILAAENTGSRSTVSGRSAQYNDLSQCATQSGPAQYDHGFCGGSELWAYSPRMLQPFWRSIRGGHYYMVDGTPVVSDVLFTKGSNNPGTVCTSVGQSGCGWEYRTVLLQCLGGGGPGCFAIDVTNPFADPPRVLWERQFTGITGRGTSTSRPQIARVRRTISGVSTPYYVGLMGGGLNESVGGNRRGTFIAVGLEDGAVFTSSTRANADFAGAPTCLDTDFDSFVDTCYIAATDATVWKVRFTNGEVEPAGSIVMQPFFSARGAVANAGLPGWGTLRAYGRVVATFDVDKRLNLFYGTGNFEDISNPNERNYFFKIRDLDPQEAPVPLTGSINNSRLADACSDARSGTFPGQSNDTGILPLAPGEKILFDPVISAGTTFFTSYVPNTNLCLPGNGALYGIDHDTCDVGIDTDGDGEPDQDRIGGLVGLPASPTVNEAAGTVITSTDRGPPNTTAARTPPPTQVPMLKLWWRRMAF